VQVLDRGSVPLEKSSPRRSIYMIAAALGSLCFSIFLSLWFDLALKRGVNREFRKISETPGIHMNKIESRIAGKLIRIAEIIEKKQNQSR
jgi:hypothetical protein